ncbi:MAG TPA: hypothetical protein VMI55_03170 [Thermoplasmata archaeon]|nr:hypothetical protein [Thermoplasmata archaeon]
MPPSGASSHTPNPFEDWINALANRHGRIDVRLEEFSLKLPYIPESVQLNGTLSISFHMRELSDKEKEAHIAKEIRALK